jgi:exopolyphosphatase/guanosine-5'-triphosphate,3'-diphosphate pyrophosphatase
MRTPTIRTELSFVSGALAPRRYAVIDLGAGAFHLTEAQLGARGQIRDPRGERRAVRMLEPLATGHLDDASWGVGRGAYATLASRARASGATVLTVASSWFGEMDNGPEFLADLRGAAGDPIELLDAEQEARLVWNAARAQAPWARGPVAVLSIGASCVQLGVGLGDLCMWSASLPIGALRLRAKCLAGGAPLDGACVRSITDAVLQIAEDTVECVREFRPSTLLLAGGTCRALGRLGRALPTGPAARVLGPNDAASLVALLSGRGAAAVEALGVPRDRADVLGPAAIVLTTFLSMLGLETGVLVRAGLREGVLLRERRHDDCQ